MSAKWVVTQDGSQVSPALASEDEAWAWLLRHQGQSTDYALRYGGYAISQTDAKEGEA